MARGTQSEEAMLRLLEDARAGSSQALGQLLEACRPYLLVVANRQFDPDLRRKAGCSDLLQDTFYDAQRDFSRFHGETQDELRAWLLRILLNNLAETAQRYRGTCKRQVDREVSLAGHPDSAGDDALVDTGPSPSAQAMAREQDDEVERVLRRLPEHYRDIIRLRHHERLPFAEIGQRTGRSAEAARKVWMRALEQMRQILEAGHGPD
jgi:RNA polymerase sigma-70 factor (ECF subfamily)